MDRRTVQHGDVDGPTQRRGTFNLGRVFIGESLPQSMFWRRYGMKLVSNEREFFHSYRIARRIEGQTCLAQYATSSLVLVAVFKRSLQEWHHCEGEKILGCRLGFQGHK